MSNQNTSTGWSKDNHSIFENFALDLIDYMADGALPGYGDQDVRHGLELQKKRLGNYGLTMEYEFTPRGHFANGGGPMRSWSDDCYTNTMECRTCRLKRRLCRDNEQIYANERNVIMYQIVTNAHSMEAVAQDLYTCPNCGAISKVQELQSGCSHCGTFFKVSELFPKVSGYYFVEDVGGTPTEVKSSVWKVMLPFMVIGVLVYIIYAYVTGMCETLLGSVVAGTFAGVLGGGILGYFVWAIGTLGKIFKGAAESVPMLVNTAGSGDKFVKLMQKHSPEFSYEYFSNKVVSMVKMLIFTEDADNLPIYAGEPLGERFHKIVESTYKGAVALKQFKVQGDICYVTVDVYMEDLYDMDKWIRCQDDKFTVRLHRNISKPIDYNFSIKKLHCKNCNDSFDATKMKCCPSCQTAYDMAEEDWVIDAMIKG